MAEAASISYGNEFSSEPRKSPLNKHIPESSKVRKTHHPWRGFLVRHFPLRRLVGYWIAQCAGAILAAACLRLFLGNVAHLGTTLPAGSGGAWQSFGLEALLTFFLKFVIMAMATDTRAVGQAAALAIGATVGLEALFAGPISGASMKPARSLGPALVSWTWTAQWVYVLAPLLGALVGTYAYRLLRDASRSTQRSSPKTTTKHYTEQAAQ